MNVTGSKRDGFNLDYLLTSTPHQVRKQQGLERDSSRLPIQPSVKVRAGGDFLSRVSMPTSQLKNTEDIPTKTRNTARLLLSFNRVLDI